MANDNTGGQFGDAGGGTPGTVNPNAGGQFPDTPGGSAGTGTQASFFGDAASSIITITPGDNITVNGSTEAQSGTTFTIASTASESSGETYTLVEQNQHYYLRRDSDGTLVGNGVPVGADEIIAETINGQVWVALARDETVLSDAVETKMAVEVTGISGTQDPLLRWLSDNGRLVLNHTPLDNALAARVQSVNGTTPDAAGNVEVTDTGHDNIGGLLSIQSTPNKVAEIGIYDTDAVHIGQQFVLSTVDNVNDIQDINLNSEPASGASTENLAQRIEITLNKATSIVDGELRVPTTQAVFDYIQEIETNPVTAAAVRAVLQNNTASNGIIWTIDPGTGDIIGVANADTSKADIATTVIDSDIGLTNDEVTSIRVGGVVRQLATGPGSENAVEYIEQELTEPQQIQARNNINAQEKLTNYAPDTWNAKQDALSADQLDVVNADPFSADHYTATAHSVIDSDVGLNASQEVVSITVDGTPRNIHTGTDGQSAAQVETQITNRLDDGAGVSTNDDNAYTTTEADRLLGLKQDSLDTDQLAVVNADPFTSADYTATSANVIDTDIGLDSNNRVTSIRVGDDVRQISGSGSSEDAVLYTEQTLTDPQQTQARTNISAASTADVNAKADTSTTVIDTDIGLDSNNRVTSIRVGNDVRSIAGGGEGIEILSSDPASPTEGQVWFNTSQELIKYYDGELTLTVSKFLGYFNNDPTFSSVDHSDGDSWYNTNENDFKYFSGSGVVHTILTDLDSITKLSDGQAVLDSIATEATTRAENDAIETANRTAADENEAIAREAGDEAERDFVETTLHVNPADSQSYYQFDGKPAIFSEVPATDYGITVAMAENITDVEALSQAEALPFTPSRQFKLRLRFNDGASDTKEYVVTTGGYNFTISDERTSETFTLPTIEGTYSAGSVFINGTNTQRQNCFLAIGGWYGRIAQVDMAHVLDVSNGNILTGRTLEVGQDYSEHTIADNNNTAVVGLVFDNQTTGSHTGINAYVLQRRNRIVRYRASASGGLFSFRNGNSVVDRFNPSRVPNVVETNVVDESNWLGLEMVTIQAPISNTAANGDGNRLTYAVGDKMLIAVGAPVASTSAGILVPGIASTKNPSTFAGGNVNLGLFYTGGEDPSEEYSNYSGSGSGNNEASFNATIYDMEYSNASGAWTFFFGGISNNGTSVMTRAAGFFGTSPWNMATITDDVKSAAGGNILSVTLGGNIAGLASDTHYWVTTELGALWVTKTPWLASGYSNATLLQAHTNSNDPTSDIKRDFSFRGFQYFDEHGSIGAGDDGHIYRLVINPEVTFTVTFGNVTHTAIYRFNDDTAAMHTFFGNPASYSPTLAGSGISLTTTAPGGEPADQLYLDYSVNGQNTPVVSYQWVGVLSTTDDDFTTYNPFRRIDLANTVVDIHYPDGGATYHIPISSNINDYVVGAEAQGAVDQIAAAVNTHSAQGHTAVRVDGTFADAITGTRPVLRLDQEGTHALENAPTVTIAHPSGMNTGDLSVMRFANGGFDTIGRPGGLFDPNNYDTRAEADAKIAAIVSSKSSGTTVTANTGAEGTTYPALDTVQLNTEIFDVRRGLQPTIDSTSNIPSVITTEIATKQNQIEDWKVNTAYLVGDEIFTPLGAETLMWRCDVAHTSSATAGDGSGNSRPRFNVDNTNWTVIGFNDIHTWTSTFAYGVGDLVTYVDTTTLANSGIYQCILGNAGNSPPNTTYWTLLSARIDVFSGDTKVSNGDTTGISFASSTTAGLSVVRDGPVVDIRVGVPTTGSVPTNWDNIGGVSAAQVESFFADSTASRGVSYSESGGVITTTVAADTSKQDLITSSNRVPTVNIGTGAINNSELNTLDGIDTTQTIQQQLDAKSGNVPEIYQNTPTGTAGTGLFLTTSNSTGDRLRYTVLPDTGTGGSALKGILTGSFVATSITGGGNATWTESAGLQFTSTTTPPANKRYMLRFDVTGPVIFEFNSNDVQFANSQWQIHRADVVIVSGNVAFGDNLAYNPAGTVFADIYTGDLSLGSGITLSATGVLDSTASGGRTQIDSFFQTVAGVRYIAKLFQAGSVLTYNATRRTADGTLSTLLNQTTTQNAFDAFEANPSTIPFGS